MKILYHCPICKKNYGTPEEAETCLNQIPDDGGFKVGDIVLIPGHRHGWVYNERWIAHIAKADMDSASHFDHVDTYHAWYVITEIDQDVPHNRHTLRFHVATLAYAEGVGPFVGYTVLSGHHKMYNYQDLSGLGKWCKIPKDLVLTPPTEVIEQCAEFAKQRLTGYLL